MNLIKKIFSFIFPCRFDEPLCKDNLFGCRCGKGLFKSKEVTPKITQLADPWADVRGWLKGQIGKPGPVFGEEMEGRALLRGKGPEMGLRGLGMEEMRKTLGGEYDPTTSPYYQAIKAEAARNLAQTQEDIAGMAAGGGRYWTGARLGEQREAATDVQQALNTLLGGMAETERGRRLEAAPYAMEEPYRMAGALETMRQAAYKEWLQQQGYPMEIARMGMGMQPPIYGQTGYKPSIFSQIAPVIGKAAGWMFGGGGR